MRSMDDHRCKAVALWESFDANARAGVRFGMFPAEPMRQADIEGYNGHTLVCELFKLDAETPRHLDNVAPKKLTRKRR